MEQITTDHTEIKKWAISHHGNPQLLDHPQANGDKPGIRINFPGPEDDVFLSDSYPPKDISWEEFFRIFEEQELVFMYETDIKGKDPSLSYRFGNR